MIGVLITRIPTARVGKSFPSKSPWVLLGGGGGVAV